MKRLEPLLLLPGLAGMLCLLASAGAVLDFDCGLEDCQRPARVVRTLELSELPPAPDRQPGRARGTRGVRARKS